MSIRLRLTLLYTAILALTLILFSTALYLTVQQVAKKALVADTQRLAESDDLRLGNLNSLTNNGKKLIPPGTYVRTFQPNGDLLDQTEEVGLGPLKDDEQRQVLNGGASGPKVIPGDGSQWLVYSKRVERSRFNDGGIIQVARRIDDQQQSLNTLRTTLIAGTGIVTLLAFGIGWLLSRFALRPIERITQTARAIGARRDFGRRVDYLGPQDEVGQLATTFNAMLTALQAAYDQTESALHAQRRFVADASHELRTPLTTIRGNLGLLQRDPPIDPEDRRAALDDMVAETERMSRLVNDLLILARADAGRPLARQPVPLAPLLDDLCRQARLLAPAHRLDCGDAGDLAVLGDRDALRQVLLILLDNAIKYTPPDGTIAVAATDADEGVAISVQDTGIGIARADLPHLFERFYRSDTARTGEGAGLGLAIARALTEGQDGAIAVESAEGAGSRFTVTLPRADAVALPPQAAPQTAAAR